MKLYKTLILSALLLASAGIANAQTTYFRFTGSTAYRSSASNAVCAVFQAGGSWQWAYTGATGSGGIGSNAQIWEGNVAGISGTVIVKSSWSGSEAGIQAVDQAGTGLAILFLADDNITNAAGLGSAAAPGSYSGGVSGGGTGGCPDPTVGGASITTVSGYTNFESAIADACMSDTFQSTSAFQGTYHSVSYPALTQDQYSPIGVVPFVWVASPAFPGSNITDEIAQAQYKSGGKLPLSFYTGNPADTATVYAIGRNPDSGTRATAFVDTGIGVLTTVTQYEPLNSGSSVISGTGDTIAALPKWPQDTVNGIVIPLGNSGFSSGGKMAGSLAAAVGSGTYVVGYLGVSDAVTSLNGGAKQLTYNGQSLPAANIITGTSGYTNIYDGNYTFWGYEHMYYRPATAGSAQQTIADTIAQEEQTTAQVPLSNLTVGRTTDGALVTNGRIY